jgi:hypothetical protein
MRSLPEEGTNCCPGGVIKKALLAVGEELLMATGAQSEESS